MRCEGCTGLLTMWMILSHWGHPVRQKCVTYSVCDCNLSRFPGRRRLTPTTFKRLKTVLDSRRRRKSCKKIDLLSLMGFLTHTGRAVRQGRCYMQKRDCLPPNHFSSESARYVKIREAEIREAFDSPIQEQSRLLGRVACLPFQGRFQSMRSKVEMKL